MPTRATKETATLGSQARDTITGFEGTIIARTEWLNGCFRITIQSNTLKDGKPLDPVSFDVQQVELVGEPEPVEETKEKATGGPFDEPTRTADPTL